MKLTIRDEVGAFLREVLEDVRPGGPPDKGNVQVIILFGLPPEDVYTHHFRDVENAVMFLALVLHKVGDCGDTMKAKVKADPVRVDACVAQMPAKEAAGVLRMLAAYP